MTGLQANDDGSLSQYNVDFSNLTMTFEDGSSINLTAAYTYQFVSQGDLTNPYDDEMDITGGVQSGTTREGLTYSTNITNALRVSTACYASQVYYPVSGTADITVEGVTYTVDYGSGACDKTVVVTTTIAGRTVSREVELP